MKLCTFCPKGTDCTGHILHTLIMKLYDALEKAGNSDELIKYLTRDEILTLANKGAEAREACWCKGFVLSVAKKFADMAGQEIPDNQLRMDAEKMVLQMDQLFSKLPKGSAIDLSELVYEIYNQTCEDAKAVDSQKMFPINVISQACTTVLKRKQT